MQVILFYLCIGRNPHGINFGIVNNETAPASEPYGSKLFIDQMCNKTFQLVYYIVFNNLFEFDLLKNY